MSLIHLLVDRSRSTPDRILYRFLDADTHRTWGQLHQRAGSVAAQVGGEGPALLVYPPGLDFLDALFGCLGSGCLAVPVHAPESGRERRLLERLRAVAEDCGATRILSTSAVPELPLELPRIDTDRLPERSGELVLPEPEQIAYLQYTSGSTASPRGVRISHHNLVHQLEDFDRGYDHGADSVMVTWLPAFHDLGLVYGFLMPFYKDFPGVSLSPAAFMQRPVRWLEAITRFRGTHSPAPNFGYDYVARRAEDVDHLELSSWRVALNGAETIRRDSEERFVARFAPCGFRAEALSHAYGMSEATAKITSEHLGVPRHFLELDADALARDEVRVLPGGLPVAGVGACSGDTRVVIVRDGQPTDGVGEVWVSGDTVARGYHGKPEATAETFEARLPDGRGPFLRTGDLGFLRDGHLYLTGRLKELVIIRGANHYPQDLEWSFQDRHPALRPNAAAAFGRDADGEERLAVVTEVRPDRIDTPQAVFQAIREGISEHGVEPWEIVLIPPRTLPKTSSGKIQRRLARRRWIAGDLPVLHHWTAAPVAAPVTRDDLLDRVRRSPSRRRARLIRDALRAAAAPRLGIEPTDVETDVPFRELGLDSVSAVELVEGIAGRLQVPLGTSAAFDHPTIDALATHLSASIPESG